jgi:NodT family efflux transporter outer membrane factor (OMF) lipoprotein
MTVSPAGQPLHRAVAATFLLSSIAIIGGCNVGPDYKAPEVHVTPGYGEVGGPTTVPSTQMSRTTPAPIPLAEWWTTFRDPELDSLIERAVKSNWDLRQATSRVRQARAQLATVTPDEYPTVNTDGGYSHARGSKNVTIPSSLFGGASSSGASSGSTGGSTPSSIGRVFRAEQVGANNTSSGSSSGSSGGAAAGNPQLQSPLGAGGLPGVDTDLWQVGFDASWEIDVFGGTRRNIEASNADVAAAIEDRRDTLVSLLGEVARDYIDLRGSQRELEIVQQNLRSQEDTLGLTRDRFNNGVATQLDVARAAAQVATTAAQIPTIVSSIRQSVHALSVLLAEQPEALDDELSKVAPIPPVPPEVPVGLPSDLMRRRPDIRRAERQLAAATARIGVATADLFPKFSITGLLGLDSTQPKHIFDYGSHYYEIAPGFTWPIFDAGKIRANIRVQTESQQQAVATYQQAVLNALRDVEDALVVYENEQVRRKALAEAVDADKQAVDLATDQYKQGVADFLTVLDAQRELYAAQDALVQSDRTVSGNLVTLYKALGGGWEIEQKPTASE